MKAHKVSYCLNNDEKQTTKWQHIRYTSKYTVKNVAQQDTLIKTYMLCN